MPMPLRQLVLSLLFLALAAASTVAWEGDDVQKPSDVSGEITLVPPNSSRAGDASQVVVWLAPATAVKKISATATPTHYRLLQKNKHFDPSLLVIPVGSVVDFPNADPWFHNVFSLYRGKRFDLGLYQAGAQRSVKFDRIGPSYLFCNIHPEMKGVVLAVDSEFFDVSDKAGHYSISGVPPGKYVLHVWYENAKPEALQALQRVVTIENGNRVLSAISVPVVNQTQGNHKNKYGQDYDPDTLKKDY
jgi:plastocyanin